MLPLIFLLHWLQLGSVLCSQGRTCCKYSCDQTALAMRQCPDWCDSDQSCVLRNQSGLVETVVPGCKVLSDTKKDKTKDSFAECLAQQFNSQSRLGADGSSLPFHIVAYPFVGASQKQSTFTGIDLRYQFGRFGSLRFRIKNTNAKVCPDHDSHVNVVTGGGGRGLCHPRCVQIDRDGSEEASSDTFLSYDCEAGFYISGGNWVSTSLHDYLISVCDGQVCGEFIFQLPDLMSLPGDSSREEQMLVLLDRREYEDFNRVILYIPSVKNADSYHISLVRVGENITKEAVHNMTYVSNKQNLEEMMQRVELDHSLPSGRFQILVTPMKDGLLVGSVLTSCYLTKPDYGQHALAIITAILVTVLIVGIVLTLYRRWHAVAEAGAVEPSALVMAGRMEEQAVLIVTPLDNPDHVEIVKDLCRYLKDWCGVGTTYFAMDDETGIGSTQRDPWKWCQETGDKVREKGTIVFIAGPDPGLANNTSIHPNLEQNQAFLTTRHLHQMAGEGRAIVAKFSYSSLKTLPQEVPEHLRTSAYHIPKQTNEFLVQLLQVKKKALCSLFPWPLVRPDIKPGDLSREGGPELVSKIRELTLKEAKYRMELQEVGGVGNNIAGQEEDLNKIEVGEVGEDTTLLFEEIRNLRQHDKDRTLQVELEGGLPSTKEMMGDRDKFDVEEDV